MTSYVIVIMVLVEYRLLDVLTILSTKSLTPLRGMMYRRYDIWTDSNGASRLISNNYAASPFGNLDAAIGAVSNAGIIQAVTGLVVPVAITPAAALYQSVYDLATVVVVDGSGNESGILIPAPLASIFLADGETVNSTTATDIFNAAVADGYVNAGGGSPTAVIAGYRSARRSSR